MVTKDGGNVATIKINKYWNAKVEFNGETDAQAFSFNDYGGEINAKIAARKCLQSMIDKRLAYQTIMANAAINRSKALELDAASI